MTKEELGELIRMLQAHSPLERLSYMEAVTVFELVEQRGYRISPKPAAQATQVAGSDRCLASYSAGS